MHIALGGLDSPDLADKTVSPGPNLGKFNDKKAPAEDIEAALKRAVERITQAIADGFVLDTQEIVSKGKVPDGDRDQTPEAPIDLVRPLLQSLVQRHENLAQVVNSLAAADPVGLQTERFITLLEDAINDVEQALEHGNPAAGSDMSQLEPADPPVIPLIAESDLDPARLFIPCATMNLRPAAFRLAEFGAAIPLAGPEHAVPQATRTKRRPATLALLVLAMCVGPLTGIGPEPTAAPAPTGRLQTPHDDAGPVAGPPDSPPIAPAAIPETAPSERPADHRASLPAAEKPAGGNNPPPNIAPTTPTLTETVEAPIAALYTARGDEKLAQKDISAARKFYEFAAGAGSARAALALARTYDPQFLAQYGAVGLRADTALAAIWYRRAALLGGPHAVAEVDTKAPVTPNQADRPQPTP